MYSQFGRYLHDLISGDDVSLVCDALGIEHFWNALFQMPSTEKYDLIHEILTVMPVGVDDKSNEAKPYVEPVVFLMMSIPYEQSFEHEQKMAVDAVDKSWRNYSKNRSTNMDLLRRLVSDLQFKMGIQDGVNVGLRYANNNTPIDIRKKFNGNAAIYSPIPLSILKEEFTIECADVHPTSILLNGEEVVNHSVDDLALWTAHEMIHHHQRFTKFSEIREQQSSAIAKRINRTMPRTAYFTLMEERQAFAFEGWMFDTMNGDALRTEKQITCDNLWFKGKLSGELIDKIHDYQMFVNEQEQKKTAKLAVAF